MEEKIIQDQYERRLKIVLEEHTKLVMQDKGLSNMWKIQHLKKVKDMLAVIDRGVER